MPGQEEVQKVIEQLYILGFEKNLGDMELVKKVVVNSGHVDITLASASMGEDTKEKIRKTVTIAASKVAGVNSVDVEFVAATEGVNNVKNVIAIMSGKGGVGKTTTTVAVGEILAQEYNKKVLIVDLDPQTNATVMLIDEIKYKQKKRNKKQKKN